MNAVLSCMHLLYKHAALLKMLLVQVLMTLSQGRALLS